MVFGLATADYISKPTTFSEAYDKLTILKNLLKTLRKDDDTYNQYNARYKTIHVGMAAELFNVFNSIDCENKLPQKIIHNIQPSERLRSVAHDYARHVCQYNQIKFAEKNLVANPLTHEYHDSDIQSENPGYEPYVFCNGYNCQFNMSETSKYNLVDHLKSVFDIGYDPMVRLYEHLYPDEKWDWRVDDWRKFKLCKKETCNIEVKDLDVLTNMLDQMKTDIDQNTTKYSSAKWAFIKIDG